MSNREPRDVPYRPSRRKRLGWWRTRQLDRVRIWWVGRRMSYESWHKTLAENPEMNAALNRRDFKTFRALLAPVVAEGQAGFMATPGFHRMLVGQLRAAGFTSDEIADVEKMLDNLGDGGRAN